MRTAVLIVCIALCCLIGVAGAYADTHYSVITILHTNDLHGTVMPQSGAGGLARIAMLVKQVRADMPNVLLLDGGDIIHGTYEEYLSGGLASISAMNAAGYNIAAAGNHEFDYGLKTLQQAMSHARFPFVAANIRAASGGQWDGLEQYRIFDVDGVKIAVLGLTGPEVVSLHWPNSIKDIAYIDPFAVAREWVPKLREQADIVVVLSHMGVTRDEELAKSVPGIDFIVGGHSHTLTKDWRWVGNTLIVQAGNYGQALGRIDFIAKYDGGKTEIVSVNGKNGPWNALPNPPLGRKYPDTPVIMVDAGVPEDPAVKDAYLPYRKSAEARLSEVIGEVPSAVPGRRDDESPAADLVADAVREFAKSDIGIIDLNSVSTLGLPAGPVTVRSAFDLIGGYTRQQIVVVQFAGNDLIRALTQELIRSGKVRLALSGVSAEIKGADTAFSIGGEPVDPEGTYTVAAQAYIMMELMAIVPQAVVVSEPDATTREAIVSYIKAHKTIEPPPLGRIKRTD